MQRYNKPMPNHGIGSYFYCKKVKILQVKVIAPIEVAVADGFHNVVVADGEAAVEVGDGAGDFQDAVVGPRAHVHLGDGLAEFFHSFGIGLSVFVQ